MRFITEENPDWFANDNTKGNKEKLLDMARNGEKRPSYHHSNKNNEERKLGKALSRYLSTKSQSYDSVFEKEIKKLRQSWFINSADVNKEKLLVMARNGGKKPMITSKNNEEMRLGQVLAHYINKKTKVYDAEFDKEIIKLRPDWFIDTAKVNKEKLLVVARNGEKKPRDHSKNDEERKLGAVLASYINKNRKTTYDPVFEKEIKKLRPDWFINTAKVRKEKLLEMAMNGWKKPNQLSKNIEERKLGLGLSSYINKKSKVYDSEFEKEIKKLSPDWFKKK